jgi:hypothetical protein
MAARHASQPTELRVGDRVRFSFGGRRVLGTIVEDRGPLAAGGRQIFAVRAKLDLAEESVFELPADELQAA